VFIAYYRIEELYTSMKIKIKLLISKILTLYGLHYLMERYFLDDKAFILMYHRVIASPSKLPYFVQPGMYVSTDSFEKQIVFLKKKYEVIFFGNLVEKLKNGEDVGGYCAITFDDGWLDNFTEAYPILTKHQVPATIFIATGFVGTDRVFWPEEICFYLEKMLASNSTVSSSVPSVNVFFNDIANFRNCYREVFMDKSIEILKGYLPSNREEILEYFRRVYDTNALPRQMLSWNEVSEMQASGLINFGAHTENHVMLDQVPFETAVDEIMRSRLEIERQLDEKVKIFAYPNGNQNENIRCIIAEHGFDAAVTTCKGFVGENTLLMEIPRIGIHEDVSNTVPMFRSRILFRKF